jgi:hypothetical protein
LKKEDFKKLRFNGQRLKRGLFLALIPPLVVGASVRDRMLGKVFNADLNGALNLAIKKLGKKVREEFLKLKKCNANPRGSGVLVWLDKLSRALKGCSPTIAPTLREGLTL